jgi:Tfp pilus assembly protein PilO
LKVKTQREGVPLNNRGSSTIHDLKGQMDQLQSLMASNENMKRSYHAKDNGTAQISAIRQDKTRCSKTG